MNAHETKCWHRLPEQLVRFVFWRMFSIFIFYSFFHLNEIFVLVVQLQSQMINKQKQQKQEKDRSFHLFRVDNHIFEVQRGVSRLVVSNLISS